MKAVMFVLAVFAALCSVFAFVPTMPVPTSRPRQFPTFPGQGPFNPKVGWPYPRPQRMF
ncbi:abaecin [Xylocopa sonorina]|uniref:abaecin n=1 Tax=Xylocopa sonorina TaxID=1818115 RepID=UPI00403B0A4A